MEGLDYNGLYEYLYRMKYGERYEFSGNSSGIPAEEFENLIMEFLPITADQIKKWAVFDSEHQIYAWEQLVGDQILHLLILQNHYRRLLK